MSRILSICCFLLCSLTLLGQDPVESMLNKADIVYDKNPAESYDLCETAEAEAKANNDNTHLGDIALCKARFQILIADFDAASTELNRAIIHFKEKDDPFNLCRAYSLKSVLLRKMGDLEASHIMLLQVLDLNKKSGNTSGAITSYGNLTINYKEFGDTDSMKYCLEELAKLTDDFEPTQYYYYYQNWGLYYLEIDNSKRAIQQFQLALAVAENEKMTDAKATCLMFLSRAFLQNGQHEKADEYGELSYIFSQENNLIYETSEALIEWMKAKEKLGDYKGAFELQKKWVKIDKKIYDLEKIRRVKTIEGQLALAEKEIEIAEGEIALKESNLSAEKERTKSAWLLGSILIVAVMLLFTLYIYNKTRKLNSEISGQKQIVELKSLKLEEALGSIQDSLEYSKMIQNTMLPSQEEFSSAFKEHFILYKPKDIVSGDFYWIHNTEEGSILAVGDCTGHGVPGAMVSMVCHEALNKVIIEQNIQDPGKALDAVRDIVVQTFKKRSHHLSDGMDICLIKIEKNEVSYAGANNSLWIYRKSESQCPDESVKLKVTKFEHSNLIELKSDKQPIGHYHDPKPFNTQSFLLQAEDKLYLYSDGYADQFGGDKGKKLKASNFKELISKSMGLELHAQGESLDKIFEEWKGELEQLDDVCVIGVRV